MLIQKTDATLTQIKRSLKNSYTDQKITKKTFTFKGHHTEMWTKIHSPDKTRYMSSYASLVQRIKHYCYYRNILQNIMIHQNPYFMFMLF